ncbi:hypothetical protein BH10ACT3_BH10ACT3_20120 [soil metagenome]
MSGSTYWWWERYGAPMALLRRKGTPTWTAVLFPLVVGIICLVAAVMFFVEDQALVGVVLLVFAAGDFLMVSSDVRYLMARRTRR